MAQQDIIEKIEKVTEKRSPAKLDYQSFEPETRLAPNQEKFDGLMGAADKVPADKDVGDVRKIHTAKNSLVDEVANIDRLANQAQQSPKQLVAQAEDVMGKIETLKKKLSSVQNVELPSSVQQQLKNKLSHIDDNLRVAMSRSGIEYTPPPPMEKAQGPINRFLGLLTDSQDKLQNLTNDIARVDAAGEPFSPATMLVLQMKVGMMQQEVEFFTTLLNKALESTKTIMNVQV